MLKQISILILMFFSLQLVAQEGRTVIGRNQLLIGQQTSLTYMIKLNGNKKVNFNPFKTFIPAKIITGTKNKSNNQMVELEIMKRFHDTIVSGKNKERIWIGGYKITAWDSGYFEIPSVEIKFGNQKLILPSALIQVNLVPAEKDKDIYDIKESFTKLPNEPFSDKMKRFASNYWWLILPIALMTILIFFFIKRKTKEPKAILTNELSLKEKAILEIEKLENEKLWSKGMLKKHYVELSFILRSFLGKEFGINLLEKTTYETKLLLAQIGLTKQTIEEINEILIQSDMVKFAKSTPEELEILSISSLAKKIILETDNKKKLNVN
ncbi:MAG: hypothetical protein HYR91_09645 [Flavobacteriia bacterium]|nr:hypothetical protein [Flavobacteriia bacterium]